MANRETLLTIFRASPDVYSYYVRSVNVVQMYQSDPRGFAAVFFSMIPEMDSKTLRVIAYQFWIVGINIGHIFENCELICQLNILERIKDLTPETVMVMMKYKFPAYPRGDLFFWQSLPLSPDLEYLNFILDLCIHLKIDLNHVNSNGQTLLEYSVSISSLPLVQKILMHRANPNQGHVLELAISLYEDNSIQHQIIRQLISYGVTISPLQVYSPALATLFQTTNMLEPIYSDGKESYFALDSIEDLSIIAEVFPEIIQNSGFQRQLGKTSLTAFTRAIKNEKSKTVMSRGQILRWPYYINETAHENSICVPEEDSRVSVDPPPDPFQVNDRIYSLSRSPEPEVIIRPVSPGPTGGGNPPPTPYSTNLNVFPLSAF